MSPIMSEAIMSLLGPGGSPVFPRRAAIQCSSGLQQNRAVTQDPFKGGDPNVRQLDPAGLLAVPIAGAAQCPELHRAIEGAHHTKTG